MSAIALDLDTLYNNPAIALSSRPIHAVLYYVPFFIRPFLLCNSGVGLRANPLLCWVVPKVCNRPPEGKYSLKHLAVF